MVTPRNPGNGVRDNQTKHMEVVMKRAPVGLILKAYFLCPRRRYAWIELNADEAAHMLAYGWVVQGGRWYWSA